MKRLLLVLLVAPILIFSCVSPSHSQYVTTPLTNKGYSNSGPQINDNGYVVWKGDDGPDFEIILYDGVDTTPLTNNDYNDSTALR